jgi:hypothetical protein
MHSASSRRNAVDDDCHRVAPTGSHPPPRATRPCSQPAARRRYAVQRQRDDEVHRGPGRAGAVGRNNTPEWLKFTVGLVPVRLACSR